MERGFWWTCARNGPPPARASEERQSGSVVPRDRPPSSPPGIPLIIEIVPVIIAGIPLVLFRLTYWKYTAYPPASNPEDGMAPSGLQERGTKGRREPVMAGMLAL